MFAIKQAQECDIPVIESILADTVRWLKDTGQPIWGEEEVKWPTLSQKYRIDDFYIAYTDDVPSGCMAIIDYDPFFWPDIDKGMSLFLHKLAVVKNARKTGVADALISYIKEKGIKQKVEAIRLDTHALRPKLRAFYERHGFTFVCVRVFKGNRHTAFYEYRYPV